MVIVILSPRLRAASAAVSAALVLAAPAAASAVAQGGSVVAIDTEDGASIFRLAFSIKQVTGDIVDQANAAVTFSSCADCETVAVAMQLLLVASDPSIVTPENVALAHDFACSSCESIALAHRFVFGNGTRLNFTEEGRQRIAALRQSLHELRRGAVSGADLVAESGVITEELRAVLATQLIPVGTTPVAPVASPTPSVSEPSELASPSPEAPASPTPDATQASPTEEATDEPSPSPSPSGSPSRSPSTSPSPSPSPPPPSPSPEPSGEPSPPAPRPAA